MSTTPDNCYFLPVELVRQVHAAAIAQFGGSDGLRDDALLESAVAAPQATFGGQSVYGSMEEVAAAYLFYLCRNHPFVDGNKRVALGACVLFLRLNGLEPAADGPDWEELVLDVAASKLDRDQTTKRLKALVGPPKKKSRKRKG
ncbi:MAG: type II toxin-antitoxin system death-on-curing family toxin [Opitutaceae bacterium]|jgi:death-on-curing protein|nr:type II toxin-antitoxin system death-on-curing family toxin [Opitutaceae bacterium]